MGLPRDVAPPFPLAEVSPGRCHPNRHCPVAQGHIPAPGSAAALMLLWCDPHGRGGVQAGGALGPSARLCQCPGMDTPTPGPSLVTPWPLPLKITLEDQVLPPRQGPSRAMGASLWAIQDDSGGTLVMFHLCPCQPWLLCQGRWQSKHLGGTAPGWAWLRISISAPLWCPSAGPGHCCDNQSVHAARLSH